MLPKIVGGLAAAVGLIAFVGLMLVFPEPMDWAFRQGGKAPILVGLVGIAFMWVSYEAGSRLTDRLGRTRRAQAGSTGGLPRP